MANIGTLRQLKATRPADFRRSLNATTAAQITSRHRAERLFWMIYPNVAQKGDTALKNEDAPTEEGRGGATYPDANL